MAGQDQQCGGDPPVVQSCPASLAGLVHKITCFRAGTGSESREVASFVVPIILSFADPFRIGFGERQGAAQRIGSFVSGLHPGYVDIRWDAPVSCVQIDLTPIGARLFFGRPMAAFATRLVPIEDLDSGALCDLRDRLGVVSGSVARLRIAQAFMESRLLGQPHPRETDHVWRSLMRGRGTVRIGQVSDDLGWSRKRLVAHARDAFGLTPKQIARVARFNHAVDLARCAQGHPDWADIAAACGYADQAHMVREFTGLAGESPDRWRRRENAALRKQIFNTAGLARD